MVETEENESRIALGRAIKKARIDHGISQSDLATNVDVSPGYVSQLERGRAPSYGLLERIAVELDTTASSLMTSHHLAALQARIEQLEAAIAAMSDGDTPKSVRS